MERRRDSRADQDRSLVSRPVFTAGRASAVGEPGWPAWHLGRYAAYVEAIGFQRSGAWPDSRRRRGCGTRCSVGARVEGGLQTNRHVRRRIRVVYSLPVRDLREGVRGRPDAQTEGRHSRQRPESNRAGHRVRLLLLSRRVCAARRGVRDRHDQLQPRDGLHRLRHGGSAVFRAADLRRRLGDYRARAGGGWRRVVRRAVRGTDATEARAFAAGSGHQDHRDVTRFDRSCRRSRAFRAVAVGSGHSAGAERHRDDD